MYARLWSAKDDNILMAEFRCLIGDFDIIIFVTYIYDIYMYCFAVSNVVMQGKIPPPYAEDVCM